MMKGHADLYPKQLKQEAAMIFQDDITLYKRGLGYRASICD